MQRTIGWTAPCGATVGTASAMLVTTAAALGWPLPVLAACTLAFAPGALDLGRRQDGAMQASEVPGWRRLGQGTSTLTGRCDTTRTSVRLSLTQLLPAPAGLLRWHSPAAPTAGNLRLRLDEAQVGGGAVHLLVEGVPRAAGAFVDVGQNAAVVRFDLRTAIPANTVFSLRFTALGLVANGFSPAGTTTFSLAPMVELLP